MADLNLQLVISSLVVVLASLQICLEPCPGRKHNTKLAKSHLFLRSVFRYQRSAEGGHAQAQFYLSQIYREGLFLQTNHEVANMWIHKSAEQNFGTAQRVLGLMYRYGRFVPVDIRQARFWLTRALENGIMDASLELERLEAEE
eukprot:c14662_g1_i2.p1 GENE.c14662_g1_i2~~c14662_g1_i2.p1  ORF type:complete len:144 (+),score=10.11 c14662_g1_i2:201-632(+)